MDRDPRQSIGLVKMCTKTGINIPREYIQPYFIEKYENEKFVKNRKIQPHVPFKGTTAGDLSITLGLTDPLATATDKCSQ